MDSIAIGKYIATLRKEKGFTQQQLAENLGITNKAISKWETGEGLPDISILPALSEALGVKIDILLNGGPSVTGDCDSNADNKMVDITENENDINLEVNQSGNEESSGIEILKYITEKKLLLYRRQRIIAMAIGIIGIILMFSIQKIVWKDQYLTEFAVGLGLICQVISILLFEISHITYRSEMDNYNKKVSTNSIQVLSKLNFYIKSQWVYLFIPIWYIANYYNKMVLEIFAVKLTNRILYNTTGILMTPFNYVALYNFLFIYFLTCIVITLCIFIILQFKNRKMKSK